MMPGRDTAAFAQHLGVVLPGVTTHIWPDVGDPAEVEMVVAWNHPAGELRQFPAAQVICSFGAGVDHLLRDPDLPQEVELVRIVDPDLVTDMVEYVVGALISHRRSFSRYRDQQRDALWLPHDYDRRRTAAVLGQGELGRPVSRALVGLGWHVLGWSRGGRAIPGVEPVTGRRGLERALAEAAAVVCLLPLTPATDGLLDRDLLARMAPDSLLVNVGRGRQVVAADLLVALETGQPGAAWLDVFADEPLPPDHPFWSHPRVTITPHVASLTNPVTAADLVADVWRRMRAGDAQLHQVDRARGY